MIVLDEQLLGRGLEREIARWYRGPVRFITDLRPRSLIKDDAIPVLLRQMPSPTFVTINERDFWRGIAADERYCVVCLAIPDSQAQAIPEMLRALFLRAEFRTKAGRMGKVIRVTAQGISYYSVHDPRERLLP